ncbi:MAG: alkaline shock response membrane anchor protein AmaP [Candidatus Omnitrophica bacterium]|nr:alkaline shock response membrane anchor protein AmaP [Candidatus Omnitrophota bacterium]
MKIWSRIVGTVYILSGIFFIFSLLSFFSNENLCEIFVNFVKNNSYKVGIFSIIVLTMGIVWIVNWFDYIYRTKAIFFDNPTGRVRISLKAIEDYITTTILKQMEGIKTIKVKAIITSKGLETRINLKLYSNLNIPEVCNNIQELTRNYLQDTIGVERISSIEIYVSNIIGNSEGAKQDEKIEET